MRGFLKCLAFSCLLGLGFAQAADAAAAAKAAKPAQPKAVEFTGPLHPALFRVVKGKSTVYLFGSIHLLPAKFEWRTPAIEKAVGSADVFMFEANLDFGTAEFHYFLDQHGYLPPGHTLHKMLSPTALQQYIALIRELHIDPDRVDYLRPGVAMLMLTQIAPAAHLVLVPGVDVTLVRDAKTRAKEIGYLETVQFQLEMFANMGGGDDIAVLEKTLMERKNEDAKKKYEDMLSAWRAGDLETLNAAGDELDAKQRVLMLDNRNKNWIPRIETMLTNGKTYFLTVGAAHLSGPKSVIELLCAKGWKVERLQTGSDTDAAPPEACGLRNSPLKRVATK